MFDCGIKAIINDMQMQFDNDCVKAVKEYGFVIDKKQLEKAITDSKSFYDAGYQDAKKHFERPHGKWVYNYLGYMICSECGYECLYDEEGLYSLGCYCHHCGADMRMRGDENGEIK